MNLIGKYIMLLKTKSSRYKPGTHPNGIEVGDVIQGFVVDEPSEGEQFYLYPYQTESKKMGNPAQAWTSVVQEINFETMEIRTANSTYKIIIGDEDLANQ